MYSVLIVIFVIISLLLMASILVQSGKGGGLAAGMGGASSTQDVFGAVGAQSFLVKSSVVLGGLFMGISLILAFMSTQTESTMNTERGNTRSTTQAEPIVGPDESAESGDDEASDKPGDKNQASDSQKAGSSGEMQKAKDIEKSASEKQNPDKSNKDESGNKNNSKE